MKKDHLNVDTDLDSPLDMDELLNFVPVTFSTIIYVLDLRIPVSCAMYRNTLDLHKYQIYWIQTNVLCK